MKKYAVLDPSLVSDNLGDIIILDAVNEILREVFPHDYFFHIPTNDEMGPEALGQLKESEMSFVGGTNLLSSHWWWYRQWNLRPLEVFKVKNAVLLGVGWHKYQSPPDFLTGWVYRKMLSSTKLHSVRDKYTQAHLATVGIQNTIYTGCPTMWQLTPDRCRQVPVKKARIAVVTLTNYLPKPEVDKAWLDVVFKHYDEVYFWSQMFGDHAYAMSLCKDRLKLVSPSLEGYNEVLQTLDCDFIGTRLHGGIRALQLKRRALILEVDNRAAEIGRDTKLHSVDRANVAGIAEWIENPRPLELTMPFDSIGQWKSQFRSAS
jgi:Polysaccharide pyruvyl transferase